MNIATFTGSGDLAEATEQAEKAAQRTLENLSAAELSSVQAQTFVAGSKFFHIITIVYE